MDLDKICGICLQENSEMTAIFDQSQDLLVTISEKIAKCFPDFGNIQEHFKHDQKANICFACVLDLDSAFRFRNHWESSHLRCSPLSHERENVVSVMRKEPEREQEQDNSNTEIEFCELDEQIDFEHLEEHLDEMGETNIEADNDETIDKLPSTTPSEDGMQKTNLTRLRTRKVQNFKPLSKEKSSPKICEICGNTYKYQHALNSHMRRHMNDKPFSCECCDKAFVSNVELRRHMRVHTGDKPYSCSYCERKFSDYGSRIKHERTHTGERPFTCQTCHKSFAYAHVLSVHLRTHTGEKKFQCKHCGKGFTKKSYMLAHIEQQHRISALLVLKEEEEPFDTYLHQTKPIYGNVIKNAEASLQPCITTYIVEEIDSENNVLKSHKNIEIVEQ